MEKQWKCACPKKSPPTLARNKTYTVFAVRDLPCTTDSIRAGHFVLDDYLFIDDLLTDWIKNRFSTRPICEHVVDTRFVYTNAG